jgi:hypothetical protein
MHLQVDGRDGGRLHGSSLAVAGIVFSRESDVAPTSLTR